jgi:hypothetical protein
LPIIKPQTRFYPPTLDLTNPGFQPTAFGLTDAVVPDWLPSTTVILCDFCVLCGKRPNPDPPTRRIVAPGTILRYNLYHS